MYRSISNKIVCYWFWYFLLEITMIVSWQFMTHCWSIQDIFQCTFYQQHHMFVIY